MINDLIEIIIDRFNNINGINTSVRYTDVCSYINVNSCDDTYVCCIYFNVNTDLLSVCIYPYKGTLSSFFVQVNIDYDELVDIDEFVGQILSKIFYHDK